jgi:N-acetylglutamate synthase-like GNAT family acetyltransferase
VVDPAPRFRLRRARHADQRVISRMVRRAGLNPLGLDWRRFTVAGTDDEHVVGCVQLKPHNEGALELASLVVRNDWRGQGVGAALVAATKSRSNGKLWLMCRRSLTVYYARFGFNVIRDTAEMSPYFRRIWHLAQLFAKITRREETELAIMRWQTHV